MGAVVVVGGAVVVGAAVAVGVAESELPPHPEAISKTARAAVKIRMPIVCQRLVPPREVGDGEPTCRRGSVHRALTGLRVGDHPSMRPTREDRRADHPLPVRPCSGWGLPSRPGHPGRWCALTAPFHPHLCFSSRRSASHRRSVFCGTFLRVAPTGREPASCPGEPRPSSAPCPEDWCRGHPVGSPSYTSLADNEASRCQVLSIEVFLLRDAVGGAINTRTWKL